MSGFLINNQFDRYQTSALEYPIQTLTPEQLARLQAQTQQMLIQAKQGQTFPKKDGELQYTLFANLQNQVLLKLLDTCWLTFHKVARLTDLPNPALCGPVEIM